MFISYMDTDHNGEPLQRWVNVDKIEAINSYYLEVSGDSEAKLNAEQYDELIAQLDALGLLYKPSDPSPPVGEPLRGIVGEALQEFMNTKGRKD
jgi:hypothetical protein